MGLLIGGDRAKLPAERAAPSLRPDLIVLDMSMPVMNALEAAPLLIKILLPGHCSTRRENSMLKSKGGAIQAKRKMS